MIMKAKKFQVLYKFKSNLHGSEYKEFLLCCPVSFGLSPTLPYTFRKGQYDPLFDLLICHLGIEYKL